MTRFGILGSGNVGKALGKGLKELGHEVRLATRTPGKLATFTADTGIAAGTPPEVAAWGEALVLAVPGPAAEPLVRSLGAAALDGKLVLDATNPIADAPPEGGVIRYFTGPNESLMERLQAAVPGARFVKAFSCVGSALMVHPRFSGGKPSMFYCGDDARAKQEALAVIEAFGFEGEDMGGAVAARAIEPLAQLWCIPGFLENRWTHAFKLLRS